MLLKTKKQRKADELLKRVDDFKREGKIDFSSRGNLSLAVMNFVNLEENLFLNGAKKKKEEFYDSLMDAREIRKSFLAEIVKNPEGELWCVSKHLLSASARLIETGKGYLEKGQKNKAKEIFQKAQEIYSLFQELEPKLIGQGSGREQIISKDGKMMEDLNNLVTKLINCCQE